MALSSSELARLKTELGYNALSITAQAYIADGVTQLFEQIVKPYLEGGEVNYSSTVVPASPSGAPGVVTLMLDVTPTKIQVGDRLVVDQDLALEYAHALNVTLNSVDVKLSQAHASRYPVIVEGGETTVRYYLNECTKIADKISKAATTAGLKRVDKIEFYAATSSQRGPIAQLLDLQAYWRDELASAVGVPNLRAKRAGAGQKLEAY